MRLIVCLTIVLGSASASAQIHKLAEMNTAEIAALDRAHTVVVMVGDILEEHGPYLPSATDGIGAEATAQDLARAIVARPGMSVVVMPFIPLGCHPANFIGDRWTFPGSYTVSCETLRSVYMELADELGAQGFGYIFIVNTHGAPMHNRVLDQASDYFHDTYGGQMVHLYGYMPPRHCCYLRDTILTTEQQKEEGFSVHANASEHSAMLYLRPDLVPPGIAQAPSITGKDFVDLHRIGMRPDFPGYWGAPRFATASWGAREYKGESTATIDLALKVLDGFDPHRLPRYADESMKNETAAVREALRPLREHERQQRARHDKWLRAHTAKGGGR
jgi:creatinine amidohydrolase/Fe(II)-dependent formamide hydrolase-like protein